MRLKVIKVTNIPLQVTKDQMYTMFGCMGEIEDIRLYPTIRSMASSFDSRICFIKYKQSSCVDVAHYLTNTRLMDRALQVMPFISSDRGKIPNEDKALEILATEKDQKDSGSTSWIEEIPPEAVSKTSCPLLEQNGLPPYPPLPDHYGNSAVERIRRTLVVTNLDSSISGPHVIDYFTKAGEVKYVRFCERTDDPGFYALVEFVNQSAIVSGLKLNNTEIIEGRQVKVYHSVQAIEKSIEESCNSSLHNRPALPLLENSCNVASEIDNSVVRGHDQSQSRLSSSSHQSLSKSSHGHSQSHRHRRSKFHRRNRSRSQERNRSRSHGRNRSKYQSQSRSRSHRRSRSKSYKQNRSRYHRSNRSRSHRRNRSRSHRHSRSGPTGAVGQSPTRGTDQGPKSRTGQDPTGETDPNTKVEADLGPTGAAGQSPTNRTGQDSTGETDQDLTGIADQVPLAQ